MNCNYAGIFNDPWPWEGTRNDTDKYFDDIYDDCFLDDGCYFDDYLDDTPASNAIM